MRILLWSETFYPNIGGVEVMGLQFVRALAARGHELRIIGGPYLAQGGESNHEPETIDGIPIYRFPFEYALRPFDFALVVRIKQRLSALQHEFQPDVFHFYQTSQSSFLHLASAKRASAPILLTVHGRYFSDVPAISEIRRNLVRQVDWMVTCSHFLLDDTRAAVPEIEGRSSVIHNALMMPDVTPAPLDFAAPRILFVGRFHEDKGADIALDAFARVHARLPQARLLMAGSGLIEAELHAQAATLGIAGAVDSLGWVDPRAVPELINQSTVVLVPSRAEAFCLVALQAGQMARPTVATCVGGLPEVIVNGETGILVPPEDAAALADALVALLTQPERACALGAAAHRYVQQKFDWQNFVAAYEATYAQMIARGQGSV